MTSLMDLKTVSKQLGLAEITVYKMVSAKRIPYIKIGRRVLFDPQKLSKWLEKKSVETISG